MIFLLGLAVLWLPIAAPIALLIPNSNTVTIGTMALLFVEFLVFVRLWGQWVHQDARILRRYGLKATQQNGFDLLLGLGLGLISLFLVFLIQGWFGWTQWQSFSSATLLRVGLEGALTGLGTGFAEGLVFRGWILDELERDYSDRTSLWVNSLIFAGLHFLKPLAEIVRTFPQFPGLVLLGLALVWAKRSPRRSVPSSSSPPLNSTHLPRHRGDLGLSIGLHAGLVWGYYIIHVGSLATYTNRVAEGITGIDGNPLAGGVGLLTLAGLAGLMRWRSQVN